jgi:hypothetical protein
MSEEITCNKCGITKEAVTINESGVCTGCVYDIDKKEIIDVFKKNTIPITAHESGIYLLEFINPYNDMPVGTKLGKSKNLHKRTRTYKDPWCFPIRRTFAIGVPEELLDVIEKLLMKSVNRRTYTSEFIIGDTFDTLLKNLEGIIHIYRHSLTE